MRLTASPAQRLSSAHDDGGRDWLRPLVLGLIAPASVLACGLSVYYAVTGKTPADLVGHTVTPPSITLPMPPAIGPERIGEALLRPPGAADAQPAPAQTTTAPAQPAAPVQPAAPAQPAAPGPTVQAPAPAPPMSEPIIPPGGEALAAPSFAQLPSRANPKPLGPAPLTELLRQSPAGPLPVVAGTVEPRNAYARPFASDNKTQPKIAVVVVGLGLSKDATEAAIAKLPPEISLSFSPYASNLDNWVKRARAAGHEVLIDLPLEPANFPMRDAGPLSIQTRHSASETQNQLATVLARTTSYVGVAAGLHSPVAGTEQWAPVLKALKTRGLLFVGDALAGVAEADAPAAAAVTLVADETPFRAAIDARLQRLGAAAERDGAAVTFVSARPVTFERLLAWSGALPQRGMELAPVSALTRPPS